MILVDTSVWIDHLRQGDAELADALQQGRVAIHPFVVGELACGNLRARAEVLGPLQALPSLPGATSKEVLFFIDAHALMSVPSTEKCSSDSSAFTRGCASTAARTLAAMSPSSSRSRFLVKTVTSQTGASIDRPTNQRNSRL